MLAELDQDYAQVLSLLDRRTAFRSILDRLPDEVGIDVAFIGELDHSGNIVLGHAVRTRTDAVEGLVVPPGIGLGGRVMRTGRPEWVANYPVGPGLVVSQEPDGDRAAADRGVVVVGIARVDEPAILGLHDHRGVTARVAVPHAGWP